MLTGMNKCMRPAFRSNLKKTSAHSTGKNNQNSIQQSKNCLISDKMLPFFTRYIRFSPPHSMTVLVPCRSCSSSCCSSPNLWNTWLLTPPPLLKHCSEHFGGLEDISLLPCRTSKHTAAFYVTFLSCKNCTLVIFFLYRTFNLHLILASHGLFWFSQSSISES